MKKDIDHGALTAQITNLIAVASNESLPQDARDAIWQQIAKLQGQQKEGGGSAKKTAAVSPVTKKTDKPLKKQKKEVIPAAKTAQVAKQTTKKKAAPVPKDKSVKKVKVQQAQVKVPPVKQAKAKLTKTKSTTKTTPQNKTKTTPEPKDKAKATEVLKAQAPVVTTVKSGRGRPSSKTATSVKAKAPAIFSKVIVKDLNTKTKTNDTKKVQRASTPVAAQTPLTASRPNASKITAAASVKADKAEASDAAQQKRSRGRPIMDFTAAAVTKAQTVGEFFAEQIASFAKNERDAMVLSKVLEAAEKKTAGKLFKGIPPCHHNGYTPCNKLLGIDEAPKQKLICTISKKKFEKELTPPARVIVVNDIMPLWQEYEIKLLGIKFDAEVTKPIDLAEKQAKIQKLLEKTKWMATTGTQWLEAEIRTKEAAFQGIPMISAEGARSILRANKEVLQHIGNYDLNYGPGTWFSHNDTTYSPKLVELARRIVMGRIAVGRREKYALARLMMCALGDIEQRLFFIAFEKDAAILPAITFDQNLPQGTFVEIPKAPESQEITTGSLKNLDAVKLEKRPHEAAQGSTEEKATTESSGEEKTSGEEETSQLEKTIRKIIQDELRLLAQEHAPAKKSAK